MAEQRKATKILTDAHDGLSELYTMCPNAGVRAELAECIALLQQAIDLDRQVSAACEPRAKGGSAVG